MAYCGVLHGVFPQAAQICEICVKASPVKIFDECDMSETCLRHVTRLLVSTHNDYLMLLYEECEMHSLNNQHLGTILQRSALLDCTPAEC